MKMTSGVRLNERRKRALVRLQNQDVARYETYKTDMEGNPSPRFEQWQARREAEITTLKKLTGQLFN
jgi:hypothetical protein